MGAPVHLQSQHCQNKSPTYESYQQKRKKKTISAANKVVS